MIIKFIGTAHRRFHDRFNLFLYDVSSPDCIRELEEDFEFGDPMKKLFDFECDTCGKCFEEFVEAETHSLPCKMVACSGTAERQLGGNPATRNRKTDPIPNMGGMECHNEIVASENLGSVKLPDGSTARADLVLVAHTHKPKTQA